LTEIPFLIGENEQDVVACLRGQRLHAGAIATPPASNLSTALTISARVAIALGEPEQAEREAPDPLKE
jgi:hypothetical protein